MEFLYNVNGVPFWTEKEIRVRKMIEDYIQHEVKDALLALNPAWKFLQVEAPILTPKSLLNPNYTNEDIWIQEGDLGLALRPETTPGSYVYAQHLMNTHSGIKPPFVIWQTGKSFRREQDQVTKNVRLKEFYQQEFQCIYTSDTKCDYQEKIIDAVKHILSNITCNPNIKVGPSERLPSYSSKTIDIELYDYEHTKWLEISSISLRTDFPQKWKDKEILVVEIAIGLDRCVYIYQEKIALILGI